MYKEKIAYIDVETTGTDARRNDIIQLAMILEIDGNVVHEEDIKMAPQPGAAISPEALKIHGMSAEEIGQFPTARSQHGRICKTLSRFVNKYDKTDKFWFVGYNAGFDYQFARSMFDKCGDKYFGSFFIYPPIDVAQVIAINNMQAWLALKDRKLATVVKEFLPDYGEVNFHDALEDIRVTRALWRKYGA